MPTNTPAPTPIPIITPIPIPVPAPTQSPETSGPTIDIACTTYSLPNKNVSSRSQLGKADKIESNCSIVLDWFKAVPSQRWCPYIRSGNSSVKNCGPYMNWGGINQMGKWYSLVANQPGWLLRDSAGNIVMNIDISGEAITDPANKDYGNWWLSLINRVPSAIPGGY